MDTSKVPEIIKLLTFCPILTAKARLNAFMISIADTNLDTFLIELTEKLLYDHNIQQRKQHRWISTNFKSFGRSNQSVLNATLACIEFFVAHCKNLPFFVENDQRILEKLKAVFQNEH